MNDGDQRCTVILGCGDRRACSLSLSPMQSKGVCLSPCRSIEILINRRVCIECIPARRTPLRRRKTNQNCVVSLPYKIDTLITRRRQNNQSKGNVSLSTSLKNTSEPGITLKTITTLVPYNHAVRMQQDSEIINRPGGAWETNQISISDGLSDACRIPGVLPFCPSFISIFPRLTSPQRTTGGTRESRFIGEWSKCLIGGLLCGVGI